MKLVWNVFLPLIGSDEVHCPKCRVATQLPPGGVATLPTNYALREVAEALEDDVTLAPPLGSMGHHHPSRQLSGIYSYVIVGNIMVYLYHSHNVNNGDLERLGLLCYIAAISAGTSCQFKGCHG